MKKVKILRGVGYRGQSLAVGEVYDVDDHEAAIFIQLGKAAPVSEPPAPDVVETHDPEVRHRDPKIRKGSHGAV